ncbi:ent-copalyl diphosphate synthase, chloroplastic-like isoform X2 [Prosopis cineraria]|uniref:ent-copalyl diphosphate synthase, chloroplastic-like isoform X2 n=1 Tax=Prosopis cineraria TaxID=364024 RepID=UPI00241085FB|nr:ent-copalyl diphosphate synthase, chloroplastic-like isoform X2 [Prosopis cineraria]
MPSLLHLFPLPSLFLPPPPGAPPSEVRHKEATLDPRIRCSAVSKPPSQGYTDPVLVQEGLPRLRWREIVRDDIDDEPAHEARVTDREIKQRADAVRSTLRSLEDGEIAVSAYDTAWVALVPDVRGSGAPQFPSSLEWIANNQHPDGSWGDSQTFLAHDRIINTLACVVALKSWNIHPEKCEKGMAFFYDNLDKLQGEKAEHMPIGFEVAFPSLLDLARRLNIEVTCDSHVLKEIFAKRDIKLSRIPRELMHKVPTTLLHSLEGMAGLEWNDLLKLQCKDGSFLFSPSSTAYALAHTRDPNCLNYLNKAVTKFNGGVPNVYPVDLFEHIWLVDRLQRLGISRYFQNEIKDCMSYVRRYWTEKGICWASNSNVQDIDDTAMGFRLLRLHGYEVAPSVFKNFERNGEFFCFAGQSTQAVTGMFNLYRASQVAFPGEKVLEDARQFSVRFLREKQAANELLDKWIIMKNLPGEVAYALDMPWHASLPRVETRFYMDHYGGDSDVWIGKTLYRMPYLSNNNYLELAKLDFNNCQALHLREWASVQKWHSDCRLGEFGLSRKALLFDFFLAAASMFEPERSQERLAWAKTSALLHTITSHVKDDPRRKAFVNHFISCIKERDYSTAWRLNRNRTEEGLVGALVETIDQLSWDILVSHGHEIGFDMHHTWKKWLSNWQSGGDTCQGHAELLVKIINLCGGSWISEEILLNPRYQQLIELTNRVCYRLHCYQKDKAPQSGGSGMRTYRITTSEAESEMQQLVKLVLQESSNDIDSSIKNTFLTVAKSYYYAAICDSSTINFHIAKALFEKVT